MPDVIATYAVHAGTTATVELDDVSDPDMVALYLIEDSGELVDASVCHQCAQNVVDPEVGDLVGFTIADVTYERDEETGHWVPSDAERPQPNAWQRAMPRLLGRGGGRRGN